jgi:hypothetical protein
MNTTKRRIWPLAGLLLLSSPVFPISAEQSTSLTVAGQTGSANVIRVHNRNYVDIEDLARLFHGSIQFKGNQIVLSLSDSDSLTAKQPGFSRTFVAAGIQVIAHEEEWRAALSLAIQGGYPIDATWLAVFRAKAQQALQRATAYASTGADRSALPFLATQLANMDTLTGKYLEMSRNMTYIDPGSLHDDSLDQRIAACNSSLASMATADEFVDDGTCR